MNTSSGVQCDIHVEPIRASCFGWPAAAVDGTTSTRRRRPRRCLPISSHRGDRTSSDVSTPADALPEHHSSSQSVRSQRPTAAQSQHWRRQGLCQCLDQAGVVICGQSLLAVEYPAPASAGTTRRSCLRGGVADRAKRRRPESELATPARLADHHPGCRSSGTSQCGSRARCRHLRRPGTTEPHR